MRRVKHRALRRGAPRCPIIRYQAGSGPRRALAMIEHRAQEDLDPVIHAPARLATSARRSRRRALVFALIGACVLASWPALAEPNRYFAAPFTVQTNPVTFGQAPSWTHDGRVLWTKPDGSGAEQVYVSELDGSRVTCLTCALPGPNRYPLEQPPKGDWILFCSWRGQTFLDAPCFGGYGTNLYVMRADGTQVTRLTNVDGGPDPQDNYHPAGRRTASVSSGRISISASPPRAA